jgi:hypothetical protein
MYVLKNLSGFSGNHRQLLRMNSTDELPYNVCWQIEWALGGLRIKVSTCHDSVCVCFQSLVGHLYLSWPHEFPVIIWSCFFLCFATILCVTYCRSQIRYVRRCCADFMIASGLLSTRQLQATIRLLNWHESHCLTHELCASFFLIRVASRSWSGDLCMYICMYVCSCLLRFHTYLLAPAPTCPRVSQAYTHTCVFMPVTYGRQRLPTLLHERFGQRMSCLLVCTLLPLTARGMHL